MRRCQFYTSYILFYILCNIQCTSTCKRLPDTLCVLYALNEKKKTNTMKKTKRYEIHIEHIMSQRKNKPFSFALIRLSAIPFPFFIHALI